MVAPRILLASDVPHHVQLLNQIIHPRLVLNCAPAQLERSGEDDVENGNYVQARARAKASRTLESLRDGGPDFVYRLARRQDRKAAVNPALADNVEVVIAVDTLATWSNGSKMHLLREDAALEEVFRHLQRLRAEGEHHFVTGVCIVACRPGPGSLLDFQSGVITTKVKWRSDVPDADLWAYAQTKESIGRAGGYSIQGFASCFVADLEGSESSVLGLPLEWISKTLKEEFNMPVWSLLHRTCGWRSPKTIKKCSGGDIK
jgi:predicted house-cleaning NTP pyrophosphatase (Maf/HAM1 superfamily)